MGIFYKQFTLYFRFKLNHSTHYPPIYLTKNIFLNLLNILKIYTFVILHCFQATNKLRKIHMIWKNKRYKITQDLKRKKQIELKMLAEYLFKGS